LAPETSTSAQLKRIMCTSETTQYFHNTETMGDIHHALSRRPLPFGGNSDTIDLFLTASLMLVTLPFK
jgi:hypothetical protein